jgi:hypothetical protein
MKKSKKLTLAAALLTVCAAFALTGCSVIEGVFGHGGKITDAVTASLEYGNDMTKPITVTIATTKYEKEKELIDTREYVVVGTSMQVTYTDQELNADGTTETTVTKAYQYYKKINEDPAIYSVRYAYYEDTLWVESTDSSAFYALFNRGMYGDPLNLQEHANGNAGLVLQLADYFKKDGDGYVFDSAQAVKAVKDLKKKGASSSEAVSMLGSKDTLRIALKDDKFSEIIRERYSYTIVNGEQALKKTIEKTTYTYGGEITLPAIPAA